MATYTPNFSLTMPDYAEPADVAVLNGNTSQIDSLIYQGRRMAVGGYDSTATYNTGDLVEYSNALYRCKEDGVTGTWDATKWELTTLADEIESKGEGGADVTKEVSGNPVEFDDGSSAPLVKCVSAITGSQELHGYDKPWVGGAGKNKLPLVLADIKSANTSGTWSGNAYTISGVTFFILTDNGGNVTGINLNGTSTGGVTFNLFNSLSIPFSGEYKFIGISGFGSGRAALTCDFSDSSQVNVYNTTITENKSSNLTHSHIYIWGNNTFSNITIYPMVMLATETDSTFAPYSNICPITAYDDGEIEEMGKNLAYLEQGTLSIYTGIEEPSDKRVRTEFIKVNAGDTYISSTNGWSVRNGVAYDKNKNYIHGGLYPDLQTNLLTIPTGVYYIRLIYSHADGNEDCTPSDYWYQLEKGSSPTTYEPYTSTTHTTTYPSAIYRGSEDVVEGTVECEIPITKMQDLTWNYSSPSGLFYSRTLSTEGILKPPVSGGLFCLSNKYGRYTEGHYDTMPDGSMMLGDSYFSASNTDILIRDSRFDNVSDFVASLTNDDVVAYELATPTTSSVTPTNLPIKSLNGYNHIESSTGDLDIEYITEDFQPIVDLIEANASEPYSDDYTLDTEIEVGTWVDGSTLYRKTKEITGVKNAGYEGTIYTAGSGEHIVKLDGCIYNDYYSGMAYPINMAYSTNNGTMAFSTYVTGSNAEEVLFKNGWNSAVSKIYLVVYYIKSSS